MADDAAILRWLELTAELHRAGDDQARWPRAFAELCAAMDCPDVFGDGATVPPPASPDDMLAARVAARARDRAATCTSRFGKGPAADEAMRRACLAVLDHVDLALAGMRRQRLADRATMLGATLDAIGRPLLVCSAAGELVHANRAGQEELRGGWLSMTAGRLWVGQGPSRWAWTPRAEAGGAWHVPLPLGAGQAAELWCRPIGRAGDPSELFLLSLTLGPAPAGVVEVSADVHTLAELTPRQRELAGHLRGGSTLAAAARAMGISRRTAIDHQRALFALSHTRRLTELVVWLRRLAEA